MIRKIKREDNNIRNKGYEITTDSIDIKMLLKDYHEQFRYVQIP